MKKLVCLEGPNIHSDFSEHPEKSVNLFMFFSSGFFCFFLTLCWDDEYLIFLLL